MLVRTAGWTADQHEVMSRAAAATSDDTHPPTPTPPPTLPVANPITGGRRRGLPVPLFPAVWAQLRKARSPVSEEAHGEFFPWRGDTFPKETWERFVDAFVDLRAKCGKTEAPLGGGPPGGGGDPWNGGGDAA